MKKNKLKKIFIIFSLCVFLLSMFSVSSFALNISDAAGGDLYKFEGQKSVPSSASPAATIQVKGFLVDKTSGVMTPFSSLSYGAGSNGSSLYYFLHAVTASGNKEVVTSSGSNYDVLIDYSDNTVSKSYVDSIFSQRFNYTVSALSSVPYFFNKVKTALSGGTNDEGVAYDGLLGMISKFGNFLVSSPLLLVLCIALPLVSFSVGLIIRIKNRA